MANLFAKLLALLLASNLIACTYSTDAYESDEMIPPILAPGRPEQWGTQRVIQAGEFYENVLIPLTTLDGATLARRVPQTQAIVFDARIPVGVTGNFVLYWVLEIGAGGGRTILSLDAGGVNQITVPAETVRISIVAKQPMTIGDPSPFIAPNLAVQLAVFMADGSTSTAAPTYTTQFAIDAAGAATVEAPAGATGFRIAGSPTVASPYTADTLYTTESADGGQIDYFSGDFLEDIRYATMPFNGQAIKLVIDNGGNASNIAGWIEWELDL